MGPQKDTFPFKVGSSEILLDISSSFVSRYIWRSQDLYNDNGAAYQESITLTFPKLIAYGDISFNLWSSFALNKGHKDSEELDYTISYYKEKEFLDTSFGYTYYDYPNTNDNSDIGEIWFSLNFKKLPLNVSFNTFFAYDFKITSSGP